MLSELILLILHGWSCKKTGYKIVLIKKDRRYILERRSFLWLGSTVAEYALYVVELSKRAGFNI